MVLTAGSETTAQVDGERRRPRGRRLLRSVSRGLSTLGVAAALVVFLGLAVGPHVFPYRTLTMRTGSMSPTVDPGDVMVVVRERAAAIRPGQLLTFNAPVPGRPVFTHRVVRVDRADGRTVVTTRGDANPAPDPWSAQVDGDAAWHVVAVVPLLGWLLGALHHPGVHLVTVWLIPGALCLEVLFRLWRRPAPATPDR